MPLASACGWLRNCIPDFHRPWSYLRHPCKIKYIISQAQRNDLLRFLGRSIMCATNQFYRIEDLPSCEANERTKMVSEQGVKPALSGYQPKVRSFKSTAQFRSLGESSCLRHPHCPTIPYVARFTNRYMKIRLLTCSNIASIRVYTDMRVQGQTQQCDTQALDLHWKCSINIPSMWMSNLQRTHTLLRRLTDSKFSNSPIHMFHTLTDYTFYFTEN